MAVTVALTKKSAYTQSAMKVCPLLVYIALIHLLHHCLEHSILPGMFVCVGGFPCSVYN